MYELKRKMCVLVHFYLNKYTHHKNEFMNVHMYTDLLPALKHPYKQVIKEWLETCIPEDIT